MIMVVYVAYSLCCSFCTFCDLQLAAVFDLTISSVLLNYLAVTQVSCEEISYLL